MTRNPLRRFGACLALAAAAACGTASAHNDYAYHHDATDLPSQGPWMATLDDATPFHLLTLPGTHASAARHGGNTVATQSLTIPQQLNAGVRYFDISASAVNGLLLVFHGGVSQLRTMEEVLRDLTQFLAARPTETLAVRLRHAGAAGPSIGGGGGFVIVAPDAAAQAQARAQFLSLLDVELAKVAARIAPVTRVDAPLRSLRGKIVLLNDFQTTTRFGGLDYAKDFVAQDWRPTSHWDQYEKWVRVRTHFEAADRHSGVLPFVNHLAGGGRMEPWFVASGKTDPRTFAMSQGSGQWRPWSNPFPDFGLGWCMPWGCEIQYEGINNMSMHKLRYPTTKYAGIVAADFPGKWLIETTIQINRTHRMFANAGNGQCLDLEGGLNGQLITWSCHGGANQRFTMRGEQILVAGRCLDVEGFRIDGRVLRWSCNGGSNQKWRLEADGRIRSLMGNGSHCLQRNAQGINKVVLGTCNASSANQRFALRAN